MYFSSFFIIKKRVSLRIIERRVKLRYSSCRALPCGGIFVSIMSHTKTKLKQLFFTRTSNKRASAEVSKFARVFHGAFLKLESFHVFCVQTTQANIISIFDATLCQSRRFQMFPNIIPAVIR